MNTLNLVSNFKYGFNTISKWLAGILPIVGVVSSIGVEKIIKEREQFVKKELQSHSFQIQSLYFDIKNPYKIKILNNSTCDLQLSELIDEITSFIKSTKNTKINGYINLILKKLTEAKPLAILISAILESSSYEEKKALQQKLNAVLKHKIENLVNGQTLLIPAGFMSGNVYDLKGLATKKVNGHAILIELVKLGDIFHARVFNSGSGSSFHPRFKGKIYPIYFEFIPKEKILNDDFINGLTQFSYDDNQKILHNIDKVYYFLFSFLGAPKKSIELSVKPHSPSSTQNCSRKCWMLWLHTSLKGEMSPIYRHFRSYALDKKIKNIRHIQKQTSGSIVAYNHSIGRYGMNSSVGLPTSFFQGIYRLIFGSRITLSLNKEDLKHLQDSAMKNLVLKSSKISKTN